MKKIVICGSMSASREMVDAAESLCVRGYEVTLPRNAERYATGEKTPESIVESTQNKKADDLIRRYYILIKASDMVLIVNPPKRGIDGYIGANTFLEMGFVHVLHKPIYVLYPHDLSSSYASEIEAMDFVQLDGNIDLLR